MVYCRALVVAAEGAQQDKLKESGSAIHQHNRRDNHDQERIAGGQDGHADQHAQQARSGIAH